MLPDRRSLEGMLDTRVSQSFKFGSQDRRLSTTRGDTYLAPPPTPDPPAGAAPVVQGGRRTKASKPSHRGEYLPSTGRSPFQSPDATPKASAQQRAGGSSLLSGSSPVAEGVIPVDVEPPPSPSPGRGAPNGARGGGAARGKSGSQGGREGGRGPQRGGTPSGGWKDDPLSAILQPEGGAGGASPQAQGGGGAPLARKIYVPAPATYTYSLPSRSASGGLPAGALLEGAWGAAVATVQPGSAAYGYAAAAAGMRKAQARER
eukprot:739453-Prorocentrum_minimum.AAC.1